MFADEFDGNQLDKYGRTPFIIACQEENFHFLYDFLINKGIPSFNLSVFTPSYYFRKPEFQRRMIETLSKEQMEEILPFIFMFIPCTIPSFLDQPISFHSLGPLFEKCFRLKTVGKKITFMNHIEIIDHWKDYREHYHINDYSVMTAYHNFRFVPLIFKLEAYDCFHSKSQVFPDKKVYQLIIEDIEHFNQKENVEFDPEVRFTLETIQILCSFPFFPQLISPPERQEKYLLLKKQRLVSLLVLLSDDFFDFVQKRNHRTQKGLLPEEEKEKKQVRFLSLTRKLTFEIQDLICSFVCKYLKIHYSIPDYIFYDWLKIN